MGNDLYEYEVNPTAGQPGVLTDLTVDHNTSDPLGADVQGVIGASEDGEYVYFVADGSLATGATVGQPNLYLRHDAVTTFIATLSPADNEQGGGGQGIFGDWQPDLGHRTAEVALGPAGDDLVFTSKQSLTGYENGGMGEVYVYDAAQNRLFCASCDPTGAPPAKAALNAASLPISWSDTYLPRWISEDGSRVFFDSEESLGPQDTNGEQDVYEWEREGAGSCPAGQGN